MPDSFRMKCPIPCNMQHFWCLGRNPMNVLSGECARGWSFQRDHSSMLEAVLGQHKIRNSKSAISIFIWNSTSISKTMHTSYWKCCKCHTTFESRMFEGYFQASPKASKNYLNFSLPGSFCLFRLSWLSSNERSAAEVDTVNRLFKTWILIWDKYLSIEKSAMEQGSH